MWWRRWGVQQGELVVVLVVEDDSLIQDVIGDALSEGGFKVEIVGNGEEAAERLRRSKDTYRALVTDIPSRGNSAAGTLPSSLERSIRKFR
jgi:CheY-like chemotaxis protein